jgi:cobalt-precorrin 5A hydrolase
MTTAVIFLERFREPAEKVASLLDAELVPYSPEAFALAFPVFQRIVAVMATGIAVRGIAPLLKDKWSDPAVVVMAPDLSFAIPLIGGHHGANEMAEHLQALGAIPVVTTATERAGVDSVEGIAARYGKELVNREASRMVNAALLDGKAGIYAVTGPSVVIGGDDVAFLSASGEYSVGIGCRKGSTKDEVEGAVRAALELAGIRPSQVLVYATTVKKSHESGILEAVRALGGTLIYLDDRAISAVVPPSPSGASRIGLEGVAEPGALAVSRHKELVLKKTVFGGVTVAVAR